MKTKEINLYAMGQEIIKAKQKFFNVYNGMNEGQYCKLDKEIWEESIIEMEDEYIYYCKMYNDYDENDPVLNWE